MKIYRHWRLEEDDNNDQLLWLCFDKQGSSTNTLDKEVMDELSHILGYLEQEKKYKGLIIASAKHNGFIAGADISQFNQFKDIDQAVELLRQGQKVFDQLEKLPQSTVAMIEGFCLGGGLELALACRYRVVEESSKTKLGLPEVKLGIHPGWGGTVRLPRLIGGPQAMDLILTGRLINGKTAEKIGLVNVALPKRHLVKAARYYAAGKGKSPYISALKKLTNLKPIRILLAAYMRKKLREKIQAIHYPAPFQVIDNWERIGIEGEAAMIKEAKTCGKLFFSETCQNLVRDFFLQERLKGLGKNSQFNPLHVHVIGAGTMGGDIAAWCAFQGMNVTLQDREAKLIAPAIARAYKLFKEKLKETHLIQKAMDRLIPDIQGLGVPRADIIIEAIFEDLTTKQKLFKHLESQAKPTAILATNTSSIPLDEINSVLSHPERLVGIHFFNPVAKMQLVEVVKGNRTDASVLEKSITFVRKLDRLPLPVKSSPGFLVNRVLMPYLLESMTLLNEGIPATVIDNAMLDFGMPMGPITLADTVGLDICLSVAKNLGQHFHTIVPQKLADMVAEGKLGKKTGQGFYRYDKKGKQIKSRKIAYDKPLDKIANRLINRMIDECYICLEEGVVVDSDLLDAGMIFGTGFAPFRGGPIHYAKTEEIQK